MTLIKNYSGIRRLISTINKSHLSIGLQKDSKTKNAKQGSAIARKGKNMPEQGLHIKLTKLAADVKDSHAAKAAHFLPAKTFWQDKVKM